MSLKIIPSTPITIVETECNIPNIDTGLELYNPATDYNIGDKVVILEQDDKKVNSIFVALQKDQDGHNIGNNPIETEFWEFDSPTNMYCCIDRYPSNKTTTQTELIMTYTMQKCTDMFLFGLEGNNVRVEQIDISTGEIIADSGVVELIEPPRNCFEMLTFSPVQQSKYHFPLKFALQQKIKVTVTGATASIGIVIAGRLQEWGCVKCGVSISPFLLTAPKRDKYGTVDVGRDDYVKEVNIAIQTKSSEFSAILTEMEEIIGLPTVFIPLSDIHVSTVFGYYSRATGVVNCGDDTSATLKVESFKYERKEKI